ncbi:hypothetical protein P3T36_006884 [Kitasatospora sp. MAP12-15]|uniref:hypothetical protein n=1 Tax=unclassified Kitasatospora TaxID=2633591 RepID=UPI0024738C68|nr:hypothetical protein [Kitasatospora sp. MAP12-44]MDH6111933.1 hypothetical protein [Kitasatospora sp. MAP12-44]
MRITVTRGANTATAEIDGASPKLLRQVEETLRRLLADPVEPTVKAPLGFAGGSVKPPGSPDLVPDLAADRREPKSPDPGA